MLFSLQDTKYAKTHQYLWPRRSYGILPSPIVLLSFVPPSWSKYSLAMMPITKTIPDPAHVTAAAIGCPAKTHPIPQPNVNQTYTFIKFSRFTCLSFAHSFFVHFLFQCGLMRVMHLAHLPFVAFPHVVAFAECRTYDVVKILQLFSVGHVVKLFRVFRGSLCNSWRLPDGHSSAPLCRLGSIARSIA